MCVTPGTAGTSTAMTFAGIGGQALVRSVALWAWRTLGIYALRNEAAYARHYKCMAIRPLLHNTHLPLAELRTTYSQTNTLNLHT